MATDDGSKDDDVLSVADTIEQLQIELEEVKETMISEAGLIADWQEQLSTLNLEVMSLKKKSMENLAQQERVRETLEFIANELSVLEDDIIYQEQAIQEIETESDDRKSGFELIRDAESGTVAVVDDVKRIVNVVNSNFNPQQKDNVTTVNQILNLHANTLNKINHTILSLQEKLKE